MTRTLPLAILAALLFAAPAAAKPDLRAKVYAGRTLIYSDGVCGNTGTYARISVWYKHHRTTRVGPKRLPEWHWKGRLIGLSDSTSITAERTLTVLGYCAAHARMSKPVPSHVNTARSKRHARMIAWADCRAQEVKLDGVVHQKCPKKDHSGDINVAVDCMHLAGPFRDALDEVRCDMAYVVYRYDPMNPGVVEAVLNAFGSQVTRMTRKGHLRYEKPEWDYTWHDGSEPTARTATIAKPTAWTIKKEARRAEAEWVNRWNASGNPVLRANGIYGTPLIRCRPRGSVHRCVVGIGLEDGTECNARIRVARDPWRHSPPWRHYYCPKNPNLKP